MGFRMLPAVVAIATVALLSGCVPQEPVVTPEPEPSSTPVFASDEEALAAATEAYAKYRKVLDEIFVNGGEGIEALSSVAVGKQLEAERTGFAEVKERGLHSSGGTTFEVTNLQRYDQFSTDGNSIVAAYVCENVSTVIVFDASGKSVVSENRPNLSLYEVFFDLNADSSNLLVADKQLWSAGSC